MTQTRGSDSGHPAHEADGVQTELSGRSRTRICSHEKSKYKEILVISVFHQTLEFVFPIGIMLLYKELFEYLFQTSDF